MSGERVARDEWRDYLASAMQDWVFAAAFRDEDARMRLLDDLIWIRRELGLSQSFVAAEMRIKQPTISELETEGSDPRISTLQRYARAIGKRLVIDIEDIEELSPPISSVLPVGGLEGGAR